MIEFRKVNKSFNGRNILKNFDLAIRQGEKIALKGRSGTGKSTILNLAMAFELPDSGRVTVGNQIVSNSNIEEIRRNICWLPQNTDLLGRGNVLEIIKYPFRFIKNKALTPSESDIFNAFDKLALDRSILDSDFSEISGGEKQRIGLIICKLLKRPIILLDEPTSALDKESLGRAAEFILSDNYTTVLSASHDDEWLKHCNNIIEL